MKRSLHIFFFLLISARVLGTPGQSYILTWDIPVNQRLEIVRTASVRYTQNRRYTRVYGERNIIDLTCYKKDGTSSVVKGSFKVYDKKARTSVFQLRENYNADFGIKPTGEYTVAEKSVIPNLRDIPRFPAKPVAPGDTWQFDGTMVLKSFSVPFKLIFPVIYKLHSFTQEGEDIIAEVHYSYEIDKDLRGQRLPRDFPLRIKGKNSGIILWNVTRKQPHKMDDQYRIIFLMRNGTSLTTHEFQMGIKTSHKLYRVVTKKEKKAHKEKIKPKVPKGIDVTTDKRGLVFRMSDFLFDFDSHKLKRRTRGKLNKLINIIKKKYPDREIIVEGHTDSTGSRSYNKKLSQKRAKTVARLLKKGVGHDKVSYRGYGSARPRFSNKTRIGRKKNRRVEIIIKLN